MSHVCERQLRVEVRRQLSRVASLLPSCGAWGLNSDGQAASAFTGQTVLLAQAFICIHSTPVSKEQCPWGALQQGLTQCSSQGNHQCVSSARVAPPNPCLPLRAVPSLAIFPGSKKQELRELCGSSLIPFPLKQFGKTRFAWASSHSSASSSILLSLHKRCRSVCVCLSVCVEWGSVERGANLRLQKWNKTGMGKPKYFPKSTENRNYSPVTFPICVENRERHQREDLERLFYFSLWEYCLSFRKSNIFLLKILLIGLERWLRS